MRLFELKFHWEFRNRNVYKCVKMFRKVMKTFKVKRACKIYTIKNRLKSFLEKLLKYNKGYL